ncbi:MAG: cytochrome b/b6 domain-containing protein [Chloroflexi bacterium]|nr:cytochrome b/b6 domain-containing protein [Chloroflexota bacterium]
MTPSQVNNWLDIIFFSLIVVVLLALGGVHLPGNIITGRAKSRFIEWNWPHPHDVPFAPRFMHLVHVCGMITLGLSGLYIRFPFDVFNRDYAKYIHYIAMFIVTTNFVARVWYAFFSSNRDYKEFTLGRKDLRVAIPSIMYYAFIKPGYKHVAKYGPMQKMTYGYMFFALLIVQILTGFYLFFSYQLINISPLFSFGLGAEMAREWVRVGHYAINWLLIVFTFVHVYLSITEDFPAFLFFFFSYRTPKTLAAMEHDSHGQGDRAPARQPRVAVTAVTDEPLSIQPEISAYRKVGKEEEEQPVEVARSDSRETREAFTGLVDTLQVLNERLALLEDRLEKKEEKEEE